VRSKENGKRNTRSIMPKVSVDNETKLVTISFDDYDDDVDFRYIADFDEASELIQNVHLAMMESEEDNES
jgi:hypothetical protein